MTGPGPDRPYDEVLADAVRVLTEAVRLRWERTEADGSTTSCRHDWAEFITLALAGAAANADGIEPALAGRPGSWEADGIRTLLTSTVGHDEEHLLEHRTEPIVVHVYVEEILGDRGVWQLYAAARRDLALRYAELVDRESYGADVNQQIEEVDDLEARLEQQREQDWTAYGQALTAAIQTAAATRYPGLTVPVVVEVDLSTYRDDRGALLDLAVAETLLAVAVQVTTLPGDGRLPMERLEDAGGNEDGAGRTHDDYPAVTG
ncbi:MAG: hypothetical protein H7Y15_05460 [Pseudonocardia sp.]|nr:hypothetical protein [Pseudonocardia sp.]